MRCKNAMLGRFAGMPVAWWLALVVLVVNDHLLKGSGLLPGWLTGKLSDFAGLVVAPVLGCAALGLRSDRARTIVFGAVAIAFAAIKLHEPCALAAASTLTALGFPSRIWCDPTDLIAFSVLPFAAQLARSVVRVEVNGGVGLRQRLGLALAACACLATSDNSYVVEQSAPYIVNWSRAPVLVQIEKRFLECGVAPSESDAPVQESSVLIGPGFAVAIGRPPDYYDEPDAGEPDCGEATVTVGAESVEIEWRPDRGERGGFGFEKGSYSKDGFPVESDDQWVFDLAVTVRGALDLPDLEVGSALEPTR